MNLIQKWILGKELVKQLEEKAAIYQPGVRYLIDGGRIVTPKDNKTTYILEGYEINDIVYSVVNIILDKVRLPYWGLNKIVNESSLKKYEALMARKNLSGKDWKKALSYKEDAMEPLTSFNLQEGKLKDLITYPNEEEVTWQDHITNNCGFKLITGDSYSYGNVLKSGANAGIPNTIDTMPAHLMTIKTTDVFPPRAASYELMTFNQKFTKEEILHEKYWNPDWGIMGQQLYGMSPLKAALKNINRNNSAKDASTAKFQNGGVDGFAYFDDQRVDPDQGIEQLNALKIKYNEEYTGARNRGKIALSGWKMGYIPLGLSPVELAIIESERWDALMFCNIFGVPPELMGLTAKTYNNMKEAEKALTTRCAIPLLTSKKNHFNYKLLTDWGFKGKNIYLDYDTDCFTELQVDITETLTGIEKLTMRTPNEERESIGWDALKIPEADEVWVKTSTGMVPLEDFQASAIDQALMTESLLNGNNKPTNGQGNRTNGKERVPA